MSFSPGNALSGDNSYKYRSLLDYNGGTSTSNNFGAYGDYASGGMQVAGAVYNLFTNSSDSEVAQIQTQQQNEEAQAHQQGIARARNIRNIMANQQVMAAAHGVSSASPSVQKISQSSFDAYTKDNDVEALNISMSKTMANQKIAAAEARESASTIGSIGAIVGAAVAVAAAYFTGGASLAVYASAMSAGAAAGGMAGKASATPSKTGPGWGHQPGNALQQSGKPPKNLFQEAVKSTSKGHLDQPDWLTSSRKLRSK